MKFGLLIYNDNTLLDALPAKEFDATMRGCLPWTQTGCVEVRPVKDIAAVRQQVSASMV